MASAVPSDGREQQRRERGDARAPGTGQAVDVIGRRQHVRGVEPALMAEVEGVTGRVQPQQQVLHPASPGRRGGCLRRLVLAEDRPEVRLHRSRLVGLVHRHLDQVPEMTEPEPGAADGACARHVDGHRSLDAAGLDGLAEMRIPPRLLGHGENGQAEPCCRLAHHASVRGNGIEVEHVAVGRNGAVRVQCRDGAQESGVAAAQGAKEHRGSFRLWRLPLAGPPARPGES